MEMEGTENSFAWAVFPLFAIFVTASLVCLTSKRRIPGQVPLHCLVTKNGWLRPDPKLSSGEISNFPARACSNTVLPQHPRKQ